VIEIDGASNTSVNDVRIIKDEVLFPPQSSRYKVYIIDEVHMLSTSAFNALLKTIEEPPEYVVFIFATTETQKVPATIRSRCQQFHFQLIPLEAIKDVLTETANEMGIEADDDALFWIAKESTGSMRDAYTLFDQVVSFSNGSITLEKIQQKLGLAGLDKISAIVGSLLEDRTDTSLLALHTLLDSGVSVEQCIKDLAEYMRTLLLIKRGVLNESILGVQVSQIPSIVRDAYTEEQLEAAFELFLKLYRDIRFSLNPRFELELAISRLSHLRRMASSVVLVRKIEDLKESLMNTELRVGAVQKAATVVVQTAMPQPPVVTTREKDVVAEPEQTEKTIVKDKPIEQPPKEEVKQYKKITMERLPELIQEMAAERDPAGIVLSQVVAVNHTEELLSFIFASKYAMESAKQNEETLRKLVARHTGYDGPLQFSKEETNPAQTSTPKMKTDEIANTIATMFRGEVLHLQ
jgi:DNA polymerase-3 subunit gamma/tau